MINKKMSCCYYPTTALFVDDNRKFLSTLKLHLDINQFIPKFYDNPFAALEFLTKEYKPDMFISRCLNRPEDDHADHRIIDVNIPRIFQEIYNPQRFDQVHVVVVDYAMPGINGYEFCKALVKQGNFKIILLTGEADEKNAITMFNEGIINRYIRKDAANFEQTLNETIVELQKLHFQELSEIVINSLTKHPDRPPSCLDERTFIDLFEKMVSKHKITEYYLLDQSGSFLFSSINGNLSWLLVKENGDMESTEFDTEEGRGKITPALRKSIEKREVLRHFFDNDWSIDQSDDWKNVLYPAKKLEGKSDYYYCYVEKPLTSPDIETDRVVSYSHYLDKLMKNV